MSDIKAIEARAAAANQMVSDLCDPKKPSARWTMRIPADPARDSDLVIDAALADIPALLDTIAALRAEAEIERRVTLATTKDLQDQRHLCDLLHEALSDADASLGGCSPTSGGSDGRWCAMHLDYRWVDDAKRCELTEAIGAAITAYEEAQK